MVEESNNLTYFSTFQFEELFNPYIKYCMEEAICVKYLKQLKRDDEVFQEYLAVIILFLCLSYSRM